jgi:LmbE family N-acetylglucosaminyl deacetylase
MPAPPADLQGYSLLAVFAHPDDESLACGGLIARCADLGAQVSLLCVTHGEHGEGTRLGDARAQELREASRVLGIANLVLLHYQDGMLPWVDAEHLEAEGWIHKRRCVSLASPIPTRSARLLPPQLSSWRQRTSRAASWPRSDVTARS